jgi:hypothetical protein
VFRTFDGRDGLETAVPREEKWWHRLGDVEVMNG